MSSQQYISDNPHNIMFNSFDNPKQNALRRQSAGILLASKNFSQQKLYQSLHKPSVFQQKTQKKHQKETEKQKKEILKKQQSQQIKSLTSLLKKQFGNSQYLSKNPINNKQTPQSQSAQNSLKKQGSFSGFTYFQKQLQSSEQSKKDLTMDPAKASNKANFKSIILEHKSSFLIDKKQKHPQQSYLQQQNDHIQQVPQFKKNPSNSPEIKQKQINQQQYQDNSEKNSFVGDEIVTKIHLNSLENSPKKDNNKIEMKQIKLQQISEDTTNTTNNNTNNTTSSTNNNNNNVKKQQQLILKIIGNSNSSQQQFLKNSKNNSFVSIDLDIEDNNNNNLNSLSMAVASSTFHSQNSANLSKQQKDLTNQQLLQQKQQQVQQVERDSQSLLISAQQLKKKSQFYEQQSLGNTPSSRQNNNNSQIMPKKSNSLSSIYIKQREKKSFSKSYFLSNNQNSTGFYRQSQNQLQQQQIIDQFSSVNNSLDLQKQRKQLEKETKIQQVQQIYQQNQSQNGNPSQQSKKQPPIVVNISLKSKKYQSALNRTAESYLLVKKQQKQQQQQQENNPLKNKLNISDLDLSKDNLKSNNIANDLMNPGNITSRESSDQERLELHNQLQQNQQQYNNIKMNNFLIENPEDHIKNPYNSNSSNSNCIQSYSESDATSPTQNLTSLEQKLNNQFYQNQQQQQQQIQKQCSIKLVSAKSFENNGEIEEKQDKPYFSSLSNLEYQFANDSIKSCLKNNSILSQERSSNVERGKGKQKSVLFQDYSKEYFTDGYMEQVKTKQNKAIKKKQQPFKNYYYK